MSTPELVFAWDIDGTLISTGGVGRAALNGAFAQLYGVEQAFGGVSFAGRTDPGICEQAFVQAGVPATRENTEALFEAYLPLLEEGLSAQSDRMVVHPGVREAVAATDKLGTNALLTGNWKGGADRKLAAAGLDGLFAWGAFGDDSAVRNDLVPILVARARKYGCEASQVVVIGDTEADVACARAAGAVAVAVATGWRTREELQKTEPDLLLDDLSVGLEPLLELVRGLQTPRD
ncbi:MAG: HAD hydrolase-like protein [Myxococcota bacterium]|nr:HAD hydrolase-like protein [Myxococcota bacterium]